MPDQPAASVSGSCRHEPTVTIKSANPWPESIICPCAKCGQVQEFPLSRPDDTVSGQGDRPRLLVLEGGADA